MTRSLVVLRLERIQRDCVDLSKTEPNSTKSDRKEPRQLGMIPLAPLLVFFPCFFFHNQKKEREREDLRAEQASVVLRTPTSRTLECLGVCP